MTWSHFIPSLGTVTTRQVVDALMLTGLMDEDVAKYSCVNFMSAI